MRTMRVFSWLLVILFGCLCSSPVYAQKTGRQLKEEKEKILEEEKAKAQQKLSEQQRLPGKGTGRQKALEAQGQSLELQQRSRFAATTLTLKESVIRVGEPLELKFTLKNGADRAYWVDKRPLAPIFEVKDKQGKVVLSTRPEKEEISHPNAKDLVKLGSRKSLTLFEGKGPVLNTPGHYTLRVTYAFYEPEPFEKWMKKAWYGTIVHGEKPFEVRE